MRAGVLGVWIASVLGFAIAGIASAQDSLDTGWQIESRVGLSLTQSTFNTAWAGDEVGTVSWIGTWNSSASKILAPWAHWNNRLLLQFGQTHQQDPDRERWIAPTKSSDKITYRGEMLFPLGVALDPFVALDLDSQFFTAIPAVATRLFTPAVFTETAGIARTFRDDKRVHLNSRFGFALKQRLDRLALNSVTLDYETDTAVDGGFEWSTNARVATPEDRAVYGTELRVFKAVRTTEEDPARRMYWTAVDVDWQNTLSSKVTKWLSFDLFWQILYDKQVDRTGQFKQTLGIGLTWQLAS